MSVITPLPAQLRQRAEQKPDEIFIEEVDGGRYSNIEFHTLALRFASLLEDAGARRGMRVATMLEQSARAQLYWLGASWLGAIEVPVNTDYKGTLLVHALNDSGAEIFVTTAANLDRVRQIQDELLALRIVILVDGAAHQGWKGGVLYADELLEQAQLRERIDPKEYDPYAIIYTSGTTGPSKGVLASWALGQHAVQSMFPGDRAGDYPDGANYTPWPTFHGTGKSGLMTAGELGFRAVVRGRLSVSAFWNDIRTYRCTHVNLIGLGSLLLNRQPQPNDADNPLRRALMLPVPARFREFESRFGVRVSTIWGMTEIGLPLSDGNPTKPNACGRLRPEYEARLVDENDYEVADGEPGEFIVRSHRPWMLMTEYFGRPEATVRAWRNGWFHTGDILRKDADGLYYFVDRAKDYVRSRGHNISSLEVEAAVTSHPEVAKCACIGVPSIIAEMDRTDRDNATSDQDIKIVVIRTEGSTLTEEALIRYLIECMPRFMVPHYIEFAVSVPETPTAKIRKEALRKTPFTPATWSRERAGIVVPR